MNQLAKPVKTTILCYKLDQAAIFDSFYKNNWA